VNASAAANSWEDSDWFALWLRLARHQN